MTRAVPAALRSRIGPGLLAGLAAISLALPWPGCAAQGAREIHDPASAGAAAGFVDFDLAIDAMRCDHWSDCSVQASGLFHGQRVALDVFVQVPAGGQGLIVYRSTGVDSDALLRALAATYRRPLPQASFAGSVTADFVLLGEDDARIDGKAFFASAGPAADYAELYTNIDRKRRVLEIHEKDVEYRPNVLKALSRR